MKTSKSGYVCVRTKINLEGKAALRCWNPSRQLRPPPEDWSCVSVSPRIWVKQVYVTPKECGLVLECLDVFIEQKQHTCPF